jgi:hypothetical protein|eukprot:COSAG01_NODE_127_length_24940_cov_140.519923_10_plen_70_part_00
MITAKGNQPEGGRSPPSAAPPTQHSSDVHTEPAQPPLGMGVVGASAPQLNEEQLAGCGEALPSFSCEGG